MHVDASPSSPCNAALRRRHAESSALAAEVVLAALSHQSSLAVLGLAAWPALNPSAAQADSFKEL